MILCDRDLKKLLENGLIEGAGADHPLVNPASIDVRVGNNLLYESEKGKFARMIYPDADTPVWIPPGAFLLIPTLEVINVPNGYAVDLRLKSSMARLGWDHSLAFWVDPGWSGVLTMEVRNNRRLTSLPLRAGQRFAQIIVHQLSGMAEAPYAGRYNHAVGAERAK